jgi:hypothetical protein
MILAKIKGEMILIRPKEWWKDCVEGNGSG